MKLKKIFKFIYKDISSEDKLWRYRSLFNIIATKYLIHDENKIEKEYILFNKTIFKRTDYFEERTWEFANKIIKKEDLKDIFKRKLPRKIRKEYDDIYFLYANSGEVYLFLKYIVEDCIKKRKSHNPLIVADRNYHKNLAKLFHPNITCINARTNLMTQKAVFKIDNTYYTNVVPRWHFKRVDKLISSSKEGECNYFNQLIEFYHSKKEEISPKTPLVSKEVQNNMLKKVKNINLNLENFIIIIPEANTCRNIDNSFWIELIKRYKLKGFDVFVNTLNSKIDADYKYTFLDYEEIFALAKKAKRIISLRCGLAELLSEANVKMDVLYTGFRDRIFLNAMDVKYVMAGFSLYNFPHINKDLITEINTEDDFENIYKKLGI